jgi:hypothetical protein
MCRIKTRDPDCDALPPPPSGVMFGGQPGPPHGAAAPYSWPAAIHDLPPSEAAGVPCCAWVTHSQFQHVAFFSLTKKNMCFKIIKKITFWCNLFIPKSQSGFTGEAWAHAASSGPRYDGLELPMREARPKTGIHMGRLGYSLGPISLSSHKKKLFPLPQKSPVCPVFFYMVTFPNKWPV